MISVIIPLFNKANSIRGTVESLLNQTYKQFEILIIDDGSTDSSVEVIQTIIDDRIKIISKINGGVSDARNHGVKHAKYDLIFFLDADDLLKSECLATFIELVHEHPEKSVFTANFLLRHTDGQEIRYCRGLKNEVINKPLRAIWKRVIFPRTGTLLIKKHCFEKIGFFRTDISVYEDMEFNIRLLKNYGIVYSPVVVFVYQFKYNDLSKSNFDLSKEFSYYIDFKNKPFYEKLILSEIFIGSYFKRKKLNDRESTKYLIHKNRKYLLFIIFAFVLKKIRIVVEKITNNF